MLICPKCHSKLHRCSNQYGSFWHCAHCKGAAVTMSLLRKSAPREMANALWQGARQKEYPQRCKCPGCPGMMEEVPVPTPSGEQMIDVCGRCQFVWLDADEWLDHPKLHTSSTSTDAVEAVPEPSAWQVYDPETKEAAVVPPPIFPRSEATPPPIPSRARRSAEPAPEPVVPRKRMERKVPVYRERSKRRSRRSDASRKSHRRLDKPRKLPRRDPVLSTEGPEEMWQWIPAFLGMPVEKDPPTDGIVPTLTWMTMAMILFISLMAFTDLGATIQSLGLIPAEFERKGGLTFLTSFFIHADLLHLLGNLYFLWIFGDDVERRLGSFQFFFLLVLSALMGGFVHVCFDPQSPIPCVGASGGISGILAFYALSFSKSKIAVMFWVIFKVIWLRVSAIWMFGIWLVIQIILADQQLSGTSSISAAAHLGGAFVGAFIWLILRFSDDRQVLRRKRLV